MERGQGPWTRGQERTKKGGQAALPWLPGQRLRRTLPERLECPLSVLLSLLSPSLLTLGLPRAVGSTSLLTPPQLPHNPAPAPCRCLGASYHILLQDNCNIDIQRTWALADCGLTRSQTGLGFLSRGHGQLLVEKLGPSISEQERARNPAPF